MDESQLLISRLEDLIWSSEYSDGSFIGFLNEREAALACSYLKNRYIDFTVYGGYENASRVFLAVSDSIDTTFFPITALSVVSKGKKELTHRDYLGSLMGIGLKRECIGDIILQSDKSAVVFVKNEISSFVINELDRVGHETVSVTVYDGDTADFGTKTEELRVIVTSMRVDNIVSSLLNLSRSDSSQLISDDKVFLNYYQVTKPSQILSSEDVLSIRGCGKFIIGNVMGKTKRERLILSVSRYI